MSAAYHTAQSFHHGYYETEKNWKKAVHFYDKVLNTPLVKDPNDENLHNFNLDEIVIYELAASIAQMYEDGGYDLEQVLFFNFLILKIIIYSIDHFFY